MIDIIKRKRILKKLLITSWSFRNINRSNHHEHIRYLFRRSIKNRTRIIRLIIRWKRRIPYRCCGSDRKWCMNEWVESLWRHHWEYPHYDYTFLTRCQIFVFSKYFYHNTRERKENSLTLIPVFCENISYHYDVFIVFERSIHVLVTHEVFISFFFNTKKINKTSWNVLEYQIVKSELEIMNWYQSHRVSLIQYLFYFTLCNRYGIWYVIVLDDIYEHNIIFFSTLQVINYLLRDKIPKITFLQNNINAVDQILN